MKNKYFKAALLGVLAGMRCMSAPAIVSLELEKAAASSIRARRFAFFNIGLFPYVVKTLAVGEFLGDKLPTVPDRVSPGPLFARTVSGAVCGAAICSTDENSSETVGALIGAAAAIASSYFFYNVRKAASQKVKKADTAIALLEDGLAAAAGRWVAR